MATIHEKPTFVLVHGAWHTPQTYSLLQANLKSHDYPSIAVALPSAITAVNQKAVEDFQPDVHAIRTAVISLLAEGKEVVAVMHSYAGIVGGQALEGLGVRQRKERGEKGGVVRLVFVMAYLVPEGFSVRGEAGDETRGERWVVDEENNTLYWEPETAIRLLYHDLPPEEAAYHASQLRPQSRAVFWSRSKTTYAAWRYIPTTYVICENDRALPPANAEEMIAKARELEPGSVDCVERCGAGHSPFLSQVEWLGGVLKRAAGEQQ